MPNEQNDDALEARLRRKANSEGLALRKSRRDGTYWLIDPNLNVVIAGDAQHGFGMSLSDVEAVLPE
jgi:hypothetical protein